MIRRLQPLRCAMFVWIAACQNDEATHAPGSAEPTVMMDSVSGVAGTLAAAASSGAPATSAAAGAPAAAESGGHTAVPPATATAAAGNGMPSTGSAGSNAAAKPAQPPAAKPPAAASCELPNMYARASRLTLDVSWPESLGFVGGTGKFVMWAKITHTRSSARTVELDLRPCGALLPEVTTTVLAGGLKSSTQIPPSAFDSPNMPKDRIPATQSEAGNLTFTINTVLGAMLPEPEGAWPSSANLVLFDHDGDGSPGVTTIPIEGPEYGLPPSSVAQTEFLDRLSIAARIRTRVSVAPACSGAVNGTVEPLGFNNSIVGCHVKDRDECTASELRFIANGSPRYMLGQSGSWTEVEVPQAASCTDVRAALPAP